MYLPPTFTLRHVRPKMIVHAFFFVFNLINRIHEKSKIVKINVQSQWRVVNLWYHRFWQSSVRRGRHTTLCMISSPKNGLSKFAQTFFTVGILKLLSTHPIHIVVVFFWGGETFPLRIPPAQKWGVKNGKRWIQKTYPRNGLSRITPR